MTRINSDDVKIQQTPAAANHNPESKSKKKKKKNPKVTDVISSKVSKSTTETPIENALVKEEEIKSPSNCQQVSKPPKSTEWKISAIKPVPGQQKDRLLKVAHRTIDKNMKNKQQSMKKKQHPMHLSDERLKAFGINPKKFAKQKKYAARNDQQNPNKNNKKPQSAQSKQKTNKLKNKLKKVLQSPS